MAKCAVFASGRGSNFVAIARKLAGHPSHSLEFLLCDVEGAPVFARARELGIRSYHVSYAGRKRREAEKEMLDLAARHAVDLIALAGFMKLFTPFFLRSFRGDILNIHPSLLPKYPGTRGIEESWRSGDRELGITIMRIDGGVDTGPIVRQESFTRAGLESLDEIERRIHELEHRWYPEVVVGFLDRVDERRRG